MGQQHQKPGSGSERTLWEVHVCDDVLADVVAVEAALVDSKVAIASVKVRGQVEGVVVRLVNLEHLHFVVVVACCVEVLNQARVVGPSSPVGHQHPARLQMM